jgi:hypothetical protein
MSRTELFQGILHNMALIGCPRIYNRALNGTKGSDTPGYLEVHALRLEPSPGVRRRQS